MGMRYRPTKKARKKERKEAARQHLSVERFRERRGLNPDGSER
jgi:hypothetical protein